MTERNPQNATILIPGRYTTIVSGISHAEFGDFPLSYIVDTEVWDTATALATQIEVDPGTEVNELLVMKDRTHIVVQNYPGQFDEPPYSNIK